MERLNMPKLATMKKAEGKISVRVVFILLAVLGVAAAAIFTAIRLTSKKAVTPTHPQAVTPACETTFTAGAREHVCATSINEDFEGNRLDGDKWYGTSSQKGSVGLSNGKLAVTTGGGGGTYVEEGIVSVDYVSGDFTAEVSVDGFTVNGATAGSPAKAFLCLKSFDGNSGNCVGWRKDGSSSAVKTHSREPVNGYILDQPEVSVGSAESLKLKLVRTGGQQEGFFDSGSGYQSVGIVKNEGLGDIYTGDGHIFLIVESTGLPGEGSANARFDKLRVTSACPSPT